ncbi:LysR family transcriptional regulator [Roseateles asaccharophilus]|uniref:DNA-binding transcriptional LysR family regulator n=1 Tax=Roseateles asaccharophilus TaxID=582607 RepID=A0ABU2A8J5_9BURK|nr:LysR family transcriptional regulator [Roseateles asaccharophilus]MDR7333524.1 DNA-binding transcriptional LysR family regulator [Roseateles asaccharophilus]
MKSRRGDGADLQQLLALNLADLQLLAVLLQEGSVTRAAERTRQPQPAVSRKLQRLRAVLGDPLLVRSGSRLVPTERAALLREPLSEILSQVARLGAGSGFDPATTQRAFVIASADSLAPTFLPEVIARVTAAGSRIAVHVRPVDPAFDIAQALDAGHIDLVVSNEPRPREDLRLGPLYSDEVVCIMREGHPFAQERRLSLARYLRMSHLVPHAGTAPRTGPIDGELAKTGYQRRITATVPEFNLVPYVLTRSDLVFTTARRFAEHYAAMMPLVITRAPSELPPMNFYQLWHERSHASPASRWLREQVNAVAQDLTRPT